MKVKEVMTPRDKVFALAYPAALGVISATTGYFIFRRGDLP